jgi:predicted small lipoprotein YifL
MSVRTTLASALLAVATLAGCGVKGPLYLPEQPPQQQDSPSNPQQKK